MSKRKWYNKIIGFRTKKKWKMAIAAFAYLMLVAAVAGMLTGDEEPAQEEVVASEESTEESTEESIEESTADEKEKQEEKAEKEAKEKEEDEKKAAAVKAQKEKEEKEEAEKKAAEEKAQEEKEEKERKEAEEKEKKREEAELAEQELDNSTLEQEYLNVMRENMGMYVDVEFDKESKVYIMTPTDPALINDIELIAQGIGLDSWNYMVDSMVSLSASGEALVGDGYSIQLINPLNTENVLVWVIDGVLMYDAMEEL